MSEIIRNVMRFLPFGIVIVTTKWNGSPVGFVVNTFNSLSLNPPLVMFAVDKTKGMDIPFKESDGFIVNFIDDEIVFENFVKNPPSKRFKHIKFLNAENGVIVLESSYAYINAKKYAVYDIGDHSIIIGEVVDGKILRENTKPIVYYNRNYWKIYK